MTARVGRVKPTAREGSVNWATQFQQAHRRLTTGSPSTYVCPVMYIMAIIAVYLSRTASRLAVEETNTDRRLFVPLHGVQAQTAAVIFHLIQLKSRNEYMKA